MRRFRTVAIPTALADAVRATLRSPGYGHPAHAEVAAGYGPCRHCLRTFEVGEERRILFTLDPFHGLEPFPLPGPVFIHQEACERYTEEGGFPQELTVHPLTLCGYARGRVLREEVRVEGAEAEAELERLLARADVEYVHVRDTSAGCYDFRVERVGEPA